MIIILWIIFTIILAWYGGYRKIGFWGAFFLSLLLSPVIGLIAVMLSKPLPTKEELEAAAIAKESAAARDTLGIADEIQKLKGLKDQGIISDQEYEKQRARLLG
jgi:hypothetical protein